MTPRLCRLAICVFLACALVGQTTLRLKTARAPEPTGSREEPQTLVRPKRWSSERYHVLVQLSEEVTTGDVARLLQEGVRLIQYVPDDGFVVSVPEGLRLEDAGFARAARLQVEDKLSPALQDEAVTAGPDHLLVEFHPDVDPGVARLLVEDLGYQILNHADLLPNHLLLRARPGDAPLLAEWDEVAYVFPASPELVNGEHVEACPGALTAAGVVGQYVATVGDGWDGPGRGRAELGYYFQQLTARLPESRVRAELLRALDEWSRVVGVSFTEADASSAARTLSFLFARGEHGDGYPFDGPGRILAHTFYPSPPNPEPIAGDVHLDDDEEWVIGPDLSVRSVDLFSVSLHELGHALGLGHSDVPGSVMYPYYRRATALTQEDTNAIRRLYAAASETPDPSSPPTAPLALAVTNPAVFPLTTDAAALTVSGTVTGGTENIQVTWTSDRSGAGLAQGGRTWTVSSLPLHAGDNAITFTATDAAAGRASRTVAVTRQAAAVKPTLIIQSPATGSSYTTHFAAITLTGVASPASSIVRVEWASSRGMSGLASGTSSWSAGPIPLEAGENRLTVTAADDKGERASRTLTVTYPAAGDTVAPTLKITSPTATSVLVTSPTIRLQGTATDNIEVTQVTWSTSFGKSGAATGTSYWNSGDVPLLIGTNVLVVRAYDAAGNSSWRSVTVTRRGSALSTQALHWKRSLNPRQWR